MAVGWAGAMVVLGVGPRADLLFEEVAQEVAAWTIVDVVP